MPAPTMVQKYPASTNAGANTTPKSITGISVQAGDLLVVKAGTEGNGTTVSTPTSSGLTFTLRASDAVVANTSNIYAWTAPISTTGTISVSVARAGTAAFFGAVVEVWRGHGGVGSGSQAFDNGTGSSAPSGSVTTSGDNSAVSAVCADWNASINSAPTLLNSGGTAVQDDYFDNSANYSFVAWYVADTGAAGSKTVGMSSPTGQRWSMAVVEILGTSSAPQGEATGAISWVGVATGKKNPQAGSTGAIVHVSTATGKKNPLGSGSSIIGWMSAGTGKLEPKGAASGSISWVGFAIGQKIMGGSSSGSITHVSSLATGVKNAQGSVAGSITWVAVAVGKKEPEGSATGVFTHVGLATGSTPGEAMQGAAIGSIVWTGVASGRKVMGGAAAGSVTRVGTASGKRELTGFAAGAIAWVGVATGSQPGVLPAEGSAVSFIDWIGSASGKFSPVGSGVGSTNKVGVSTGKSIPLGSAVGSIERVGLATGTKTGFYHVTVLSVTEKSTYKAGVALMPSYFITVEDIGTTVKVKELNQDITVEEVE